MESLQKTKSRIKAVKNIGQITKAMEVVAATKMRKSQQVALNSRPYAFKALQLLSVLAKHAPIKTQLIQARPVKNTLLVIVTSDRGLAGSFNSQVLRLADSFLKSYKEAGGENSLKVISVGKKAISYAEKKKLNLTDRFSGFGDFIESAKTIQLSDRIISGFLNKDWDMHLADAYKVVNDMVRVTVKPIVNKDITEALTYKVIRASGDKGSIEVSWELLTVILPFQNVK